MFDSFLTDLKIKARTCEFRMLKDSPINDRVVEGIKSDHEQDYYEKLISCSRKLRTYTKYQKRQRCKSDS